MRRRTDDGQYALGNTQQIARNGHGAMCNRSYKQQTTRNRQHATCSVRPTTCNRHDATDNMYRIFATETMPRATDTKKVATHAIQQTRRRDGMQRPMATDNMRHATESRKQTTCREQTTCRKQTTAAPVDEKLGDRIEGRVHVQPPTVSVACRARTVKTQPTTCNTQPTSDNRAREPARRA